MDFSNTMSTFKLSKFKIPKKIGSAASCSGAKTNAAGQSGTKKLYHKGAAANVATSHLKPYLKPLKKTPKTPKIPKIPKAYQDKDPPYAPFKTASSSMGATSTNYPVDVNRQKNDRTYEDLYDNVELEQQLVLRLPVAPAASLRAALRSEAPNIKDRLGIEFLPDLRKANVRWDGYIYPGRLQNLPSIVESYKTTDNKTLYKTADLSGVLTCRMTDDFSPPPSEDEAAVKEGASKEEIAKRKEKQEKKHFNLNHGLTPPLKNVRKRRFRKVLKKKYETAPEIEKEVRRLFRMDNEAFSVNWELIPEGVAHNNLSEDDKNKNDLEMGGLAESGAGGPSSAVQIEDIFGGQVSSSESEEEESWEEGRTKSAEKLAAALESRTLSGEEERLDTQAMAETAVSAEELQESLRARDRMDTLRRELEEVRRRRRKQEAEIESLENPILKGRFMADLKTIEDEEAAKEAEYQELAAATGEY